tara:strand:+ start:345 stop:650 length:306 start_codon:yes stop_codon:yes gene_type:complete
MKPEITDAISALHPTNSFVLRGDNYSQIEWVNAPESPSTQKQVEDKLTELVAEYDAQEYARNRQAEYPSVQELVVALYDTDDKSVIEAKRAEVKKKYPKPE